MLRSASERETDREVEVVNPIPLFSWKTNPRPVEMIDQLQENGGTTKIYFRPNSQDAYPHRPVLKDVGDLVTEAFCTRLESLYACAGHHIRLKEQQVSEGSDGKGTRGREQVCLAVSKTVASQWDRIRRKQSTDSEGQPPPGAEIHGSTIHRRGLVSANVVGAAGASHRPTRSGCPLRATSTTPRSW